MTKPTGVISVSVIEAFCALCDRSHELWLNHLELFDKNPRKEELMQSMAKDEWLRLSIISQEYSLLQIVKLHDKASMNGNNNLGIEYVLMQGNWPDSIRSRLEGLADELGGLARYLLGARNKILSHNDLATIVEGATLGEFPDGDDAKYFKDLQEFVDIVHDYVVGGPYPFNSLVKNDVAFFLRTIKP